MHIKFKIKLNKERTMLTGFQKMFGAFHVFDRSYREAARNYYETIDFDSTTGPKCRKLGER